MLSVTWLPSYFSNTCRSMLKCLFRVRLRGSIDSISGPAENTTDLRGAFGIPIKELKDLEQVIIYKKRPRDG